MFLIWSILMNTSKWESKISMRNWQILKAERRRFFSISVPSKATIFCISRYGCTVFLYAYSTLRLPGTRSLHNYIFHLLKNYFINFCLFVCWGKKNRFIYFIFVMIKSIDWVNEELLDILSDLTVLNSFGVWSILLYSRNWRSCLLICSLGLVFVQLVTGELRFV